MLIDRDEARQVMHQTKIEAFFDESSHTITYLIFDPISRAAAIIDSVLGFDPASGRTNMQAADKVVEAIRQQKLDLIWLLETHVHADHLSAAPYLQQKLGGQIGIGEQICDVQHRFSSIYNAEIPTDGSQFDHLFKPGESLDLGELNIEVMFTPGHTPACVSYLIGDAVFVGDTLFMPDFGTARCDFPGGDAEVLYQSIQTLLALPDETKIYLCHDYLPESRDTYCWQTTVAEQRASNIHVNQTIKQADFVVMRNKRDSELGVPALILAAIQVNMRAGKLPDAEHNGVVYLKLPINQF